MRKTAIAIIGPHGSGKTTLVRCCLQEIRASRANYAILFTTEVARKCPYPVGATSDKIAQTWIIRTQMLVESFACSLDLPVILDRCLVDQYAYYQYWLGYRADLEKIIVDALERYKLVLLLPANVRFLKRDGIRPINESFQKDISRHIYTIVRKLNIPVIECENNQKEAVKFVLDALASIDTDAERRSVSVNLSAINPDFGREVIPRFTDEEALSILTELLHIEHRGDRQPLGSARVFPQNPQLSRFLRQIGFEILK